MAPVSSPDKAGKPSSNLAQADLGSLSNENADLTAAVDGQLEVAASPPAADSTHIKTTKPTAEGTKTGLKVDAPKASQPPLPDEPPPDDGWDAQWDASNSAWFFYNRYTGKSQWDNPRVPTSQDTTEDGQAAAAAAAAPPLPPPTNTTSDSNGIPDSQGGPPPLPPTSTSSISNGYNPAIHGDWDDYIAKYPVTNSDTQQLDDPYGGEYRIPPTNDSTLSTVVDPSTHDAAATGAFFNSRTGRFQRADQGAERHGDEAKSLRQMGAYFDVDAFAASVGGEGAAGRGHDGRSLKAERQGKKPTKNELKEWKTKRKARKEEKRRAWLME